MRLQPLMMFPFTAIVGQESLKQALLLNVIDPTIGGVLVMGEKGTAKSTAVRALADLLPDYLANACHSGCDPAGTVFCTDCEAATGPIPVETRRMRVVELPLGTSEDRLVGSLDIEAAIHQGRKRFEPGLLAAANRNFLYVDEVNLLDDHLVDLLLDAAAMGQASVEREGISYHHPARFVLVGSMNPEEGDLRPQLLDRFGLCVAVRALRDPALRYAVLTRRLAYDTDATACQSEFADAQQQLRQQLVTAKHHLKAVTMPEKALQMIVILCAQLGLDGHRGDITLSKAARAQAALEGATTVQVGHIRAVAPLVLLHRQKRQPFETVQTAEQSLETALAALQ